jgi:hypothetical protein
MVKIEYDHKRDLAVVTLDCNVEVVCNKQQTTVKDETHDGKPLIVLAA